MKFREYLALVESECACELDETAPPGEAAENWIKHRKPEFRKRYGKHWKQVLYAKAWKLFGK